MLENDLELERGAIELYKTIISFAGKEHDTLTVSLFKTILADEEKHHQICFSNPAWIGQLETILKLIQQEKLYIVLKSAVRK